MNHKRPINYNLDGNSAGAATAEVVEPIVPAAPVNHFDKFKDIDLSEVDEIVTANTPEKPAETPVVEPVKTAEEIAAEAAKAAEETPATDDETLTAPEVIEIPEPIEESWKQVAIDAGFAPPEDPYDYAGYIANAKAAIAEAEKRGEAKASAPDPEKYGPEAVQLINALNGGMKFEQVLAPLAAFDEVLTLPAKELVQLNWKNNAGYTDDMIADKLAILEQTPGLVDLEGEKIRVALKTAKANKYNEIVGNYSNAYKAEQVRQTERIKSENEAVRAEILSRTEYMGAPLDAATREAIAKNWDNGTYKKLLENPKAVTDLILTNLYQQKRMSVLLKKKETDTKLETAHKLANTNLGEQATSHTQKTTLTNPNDHWAKVMETIGDEKIEGVQYGQR
jgi:hypothetical protein